MPGTMDEENPVIPPIQEDAATINGVNGRSEDGSPDVGSHGDGLKIKDSLEGFEIVTRGEEDKENVSGPNGTLQNGTDNSIESVVDSSKQEEEMEQETEEEAGSPCENTNQTKETSGKSPGDIMETHSEDGNNAKVVTPDTSHADPVAENEENKQDQVTDEKNDNEACENKEDKKDADRQPEAGNLSNENGEKKSNESSEKEIRDQSKENKTKGQSKQDSGGNEDMHKDASVVVIDAGSPKASSTKVIVLKSHQKDKNKKPSKVDRMLEGTKESGGTDKTGGENMRPFAKLLFDLGLDLCRQQVYKDLIKVQKKKDSHNKLNDGEKVQLQKLKDAYDHLLDKNEPFLRDTAKCQICSFKSDLINPLELHKEYEHSGVCAICGHITQNIYSYYFHMEAEHNRQGRVQPVMGMHTCPYCPYEHHSSRKNFLKHLAKCEAHFKLNRNLQPVPSDCDIPLRAPPVPPSSKTTPRAPVPQKKLEPRPPLRPTPATGTAPQVVLPPNLLQGTSGVTPPWIGHQEQNGPQLVQIGNQYFLVVQQNGQTFMTPMVAGAQAQPAVTIPQKGTGPKPASTKIAQVLPSVTVKNAGASAAQGQYEICEICGGFVKDKESLRIHFFHAHKIEIHPSVMKEKSPSLPCRHCTQAFWTYQGYKRHCLVTHPTMKDFTQQMTCYVCTKQVPDFITHMTSKHPQVVRHMLSQIRCVVCQAAFPSETALESHMLMDHKDIVTKYGSMTGSDKPSSPKSSPQTPATKSNPMPMGLYSNSSHLKTCSRCDFKYTTSQSYKAHFNKYHITDEEQCLFCDDIVTVGKPHMEHVKSKHLRPLTVTLRRLTSDDIAKVGELTRKRKRSTEEVIVIDLDSKRKKIQAQADPDEDMQVIEVEQTGTSEKKSGKDCDESEMEVIDADDIVDLEKSDNSSRPDNKDERRAISEEIIEVDGEQIVVQKLDE